MSKKRPGIGEQIDGGGARLSRRELGKPSNVTRAARKTGPKAAAGATAADPVKTILSSLAAGGRAAVPWMSRDLRARDGDGNPIPTLGDRIRSEGFRAQLRNKAGGLGAAGPRRARTKEKRKPKAAREQKP